MHPDDLLELTIDGIAQGGDGVGRHAGLVVFARGALPGERVRLRLYERKADYARGEVVAVLSASPDRVAPLISAGDQAPWQHIAYSAQLRLKETILREQLRKLAGLAAPPIAPIIPSPQIWGYRNTARLHIEGAQIGYHRAGTRTITPLASEPLLLPVLNTALAGLSRVLRPGLLTGLTLRASASFGYGLALLHALPGVAPAALEELAIAWRAQVPALAGVIAGDHERPFITVGAATLHDELGGIVYSLDPTSFFQVNQPQAERLLELVQTALAPGSGQHLLDLYSGVGSFALPLAAAGANVTAVEEQRSAVADGRRSASLNGVRGVRWIQAPAERALPALDERYDGVVLDPPRRGCHPAVLEELIRLRPARLVYISCHPGVLGRDLPPLLRAGYHLDQLQPVDLFPQTPHIETVVTLVADV